MVKIYGTRMSRAGRCMWLLEELGLAYEQVPVDVQAGETRTPAYLTLNPSGKVPVLDDAGFVLRESLAIAFYLVSKNATPLWPDDIRTRALIHQWASWAVTEVEGPLGVIFLERRRVAGAELDPAFVAARIATARNALDLLEKRLSIHRYVASNEFTLGDLLACAVMTLVPMFINLAPYPAIVEWMSRCTARAAWASAEARL
jgi:glutathione S-transferase